MNTDQQTALFTVLERLAWRQTSEGYDACQFCAAEGLPTGAPEDHAPDCPVLLLRPTPEPTPAPANAPPSVRNALRALVAIGNERWLKADGFTEETKELALALDAADQALAATE